MRHLIPLVLLFLVLTGYREEGVLITTTQTGTIPPPETIIATNEVGFWFLNNAGYWQDAGTATLGPDCYIVYISTSGATTAT